MNYNCGFSPSTFSIAKVHESAVDVGFAILLAASPLAASRIAKPTSNYHNNRVQYTTTVWQQIPLGELCQDLAGVCAKQV